MSQRWESPEQVAARTNKPNDGQICLVIDPEDGTNPTYIYGLNNEQILEKAARTVEHGQRTIAALKRPAGGAASGIVPPPGPAQRVAPAAAPAGPRRIAPLTDEERMSLASEVSDPEKSGAAIVRLFEGTTGLDVKAISQRETLARIASISRAWQLTHPEFPEHPANYKMLTDAASLRAGGYANITAATLEAVYQELSANGYLVPAAATQEVPATVRPEEIPAGSSNVSTTTGATTYRRSSLRGATAPVAQPTRYTAAQIHSMSSAELLRRMETEPGFKEALEALAAQPRTA